MEDFVHLHVHTQYSILDGQAAIDKLVNKALKDGMRGMAITDHCNVMGIKEFFNVTKKITGAAKKELDKVEKQLAELEKDASANEEQLTKLRAQHSELARKASFKPIFGCEMYVARRGRLTKEEKTDQSGNHLIVLAKNERGYHNLIKLVSEAWTDGFYMRPRTDHESLEKYKEGLIVCSACIAGEVPSKIIKGDIEGAEQTARWYQSVFGNDYYLELQRHEVTDPNVRANRETFPLQQQANREIVRLAQKLGIKLVCTNDSHFVDQENAEAHDRLICLSTGADLDDPKRMLYTKQEWFKTREEMNSVFSDIPEALRNTCEIADKVEVYNIDHAPIMPNFDIPASFGTEEEYRKRFSNEDLYREFTSDELGNPIMDEVAGKKRIESMGGYDRLVRIKFEADYLSYLAHEGAKKRYGDPISQEVEERLRFELHTMKTMGFPGYFLIVQDYINAARNELGVSVGPGRGSAAGSCVAYCLGITQIDPIEYDLLFERFLNPDRISLPDIDVDFDDDGRGKVLDWVTNKYGADNCAHIITYGTMKTKSAIKDVARVEKLPLSESNRLCKLIPDTLPKDADGNTPKLTLDNVIAAIPELKEAEQSKDPLLSETIRYAKMLEGNVRNTGVHACGFIICRDPISDWVPVSTAEDKETHEKLRCTQYEGTVIEDTGLIKMDFLGLKTLTIINSALQIIKESLGIEIDIDKIPLNDASTFELFSGGNTIGTFQFESSGMQKYLRELHPNCIADLIAMNALYRPGPMDYIPQFINRKNGLEKIEYDLPCMEKYLKETYGVTVYQEQVMLLSREIANFTRGESDTLRKAMGKKLKDKMAQMQDKFLLGGKAKGYDEKTLNKIWGDWEKLASYAFNKSHAACYAWIAYQTGYLKAHFPSQFMAGTMNSWTSDISAISKLMDECKSMDIKVLGPDVNESRVKFSVNAKGDIRFGLAAIKGVGEMAIHSIIEEREKNGNYKDVYDFMERINLTYCNRKTIENLIAAGAFDNFDIPRDNYFPCDVEPNGFIEKLIQYGQQFQQGEQQMTNSLFGDMGAIEVSKPKPPQMMSNWTDLERLNKEYELLGIYLSGHPLDNFKVALMLGCNTPVSELADISARANQEITFGGIVTKVRIGQTKRGNPYGSVTIEDYKGNGSFAIFGNDWARWSGYLTVNNTVHIRAKVKERTYRPGEFDLNIINISLLSDVSDHVADKVTIKIYPDKVDDDILSELAMLIKENPGDTPFTIMFVSGHHQTSVTTMSHIPSIKVITPLLDLIEKEEGLELQVN